MPSGQRRVASSDSPVSSRLLRLARIGGQPADTAAMNFDAKRSRLLHARTRVLRACAAGHAVKAGLKGAARGAVLKRLGAVREIRHGIRQARNNARTLLLR